MQTDDMMVLPDVHPHALEPAETAMPENNALIAATIKDMLSPIVSALADMVKNNTEALERVATAQKIMSERMDGLERQIRLNTPVTAAQVKYLNGAMKTHARELLDKRGLADDADAVKKLTALIRKAVCSRYGVAKAAEIPKHEYNVAMQMISTWNDMLAVRDIARGVRKNLEGQHETE